MCAFNPLIDWLFDTATAVGTGQTVSWSFLVTVKYYHTAEEGPWPCLKKKKKKRSTFMRCYTSGHTLTLTIPYACLVPMTIFFAMHALFEVMQIT